MTQSPIPGPKVILLGDSGTGKTHALRTLLDAGITPFIIFTEPGMEVLGDILDKCKWRYVGAKSPSWSGLGAIMKSINQLDYDGLTKLRDSNKAQYTGLLDVVEQCNNFVTHDGEEFGDVMEFKTDCCLVIDSFTGMGDMARQLIVGNKPLMAPGEYQVAQNSLKFIYEKIVKECRCPVVMTAHLARETDEITGGTTLMVKTIGKALAPEVPIYWSDVIQTLRQGDKFTWSTFGTNITAKGRNVPFKAGMIPSFVPLFAGWKKRGGVIEDSTQSDAPTATASAES
jgi:AAA domain